MLISTHIIIHNKFTFLFFHENDKATKVRKYINSFICDIILTFPHISVIPSKSIFSSNTTQLIKQKETFKCYRKRIFHAIERTGFCFSFFFTFEHFMWLQPSFFWMGDLQLGHGFELVTSHRQLAAVFVSSSVPLTGKIIKTHITK